MKYETCEYCGAHLDHGEPCECRRNDDIGEDGEQIEDPRQQVISEKGVRDIWQTRE